MSPQHMKAGVVRDRYSINQLALIEEEKDRAGEDEQDDAMRPLVPAQNLEKIHKNMLNDQKIIIAEQDKNAPDKNVAPVEEKKEKKESSPKQLDEKCFQLKYLLDLQIANIAEISRMHTHHQR